MFNLIRNLASKAYNAIKSAVGGRSSGGGGGGGGGGGWGSPAPQPKAPSNPITNIVRGATNWASQQQWLPQPIRNSAAIIAEQQRQAEARRQAEIARQKELARQKKQGELDAWQQKSRAAAGDAAKNAVNWLKRTIGQYDVKYNGNWRDYFSDSGGYKAQNVQNKGILGWLEGQIVGRGQQIFDKDVSRARNDWKNWYNNTADGQKQKATDDFERVKREYADRAKKISSGVGKNQGGFFGWWDDVSGADDRRKKEFAENQLKNLQDKQIKRYEEKLNNVLKWQADNKALLEKSKFTSQDEYNKYLALAKKEKELIDDLEYTRAATTGLMEGWDAETRATPTNTGSKVAGWFDRNVAQSPVGKGVQGLWKYTLGEGDENIPSLVTAPGRVINWVGNLSNKDRDIYKHGGETMNRIKANKNAWQASFNQRNFNIKPYTDKAFDREAALRAVTGKNAAFGYNRIDGDDRGAGSLQRQQLAGKYAAAKSDAERDKILQEVWNEYNRANRNSNSIQEFAADPLFMASWAKAGKATKVLSGAEKIAAGGGKLAKPAGWFVENANRINKAKDAFSARVKSNKVLSWLGKEHKTPDQKVSEAYDAWKAARGGAQNAKLERINQINRKLLRNPKLDTSIFDDIAKLSDKEIKVLKRMTNGDLHASDKIRYWTRAGGLGSNPAAAKLKEIASRMDDFSELTRKSDLIDVAKTRFGKKAGKVYMPGVNISKDLTNFRMFKKGTGPRTAGELRENFIDRYFLSNLDDSFAKTNTARRQKLLTEREILLKQYDDAVLPYQQQMEKAAKGAQKFVEINRKPGVKGFFGKRDIRINRSGRALLNTARDVAGAPTRAWKAAVLKYRPAWTVNNVLYNTQANALAAGGKGLVEQAKMLKPSYWKKAMAEIPEEVKTNLAKEIGGKGRLNKFYNNVENWSRVAAFRGAKAKGLTDEQALGRVNKYLFDYSTKNWERPLKTVMPFWAWNKNLAKAAVNMPLDRPLAAKAYHQIDRYQQEQFDKDFETMRAELKQQGYSDQEIDQFKEQSRKYYQGRLKVGDKYITTPFNAFSEKGLTGFGLNPVLQAGKESLTGKDSWGRDIPGSEQGFVDRFIDKFPQAQIAKKGLKAAKVQWFGDKPTKGWIGEKGSEGYGLTKEKQGFDSSKPNYDKSLDPRSKLGQDVAAFFGVPRAMELNKKEFLINKKYARVAEDYFNTDWKKIEKEQGWEAMNAQRDKFFKDRGVTSDEFYDGVLSKNDTENTKRIKQLKTEAAEKNKALFEEYQRQPKGTRSIWAKNKLKQLVDSGYFDKNPFLKSFDWLTPDTIARATKAEFVQEAKRTGDWSAYRSKYGTKSRGLSEKAIAYREAKRTGDWSAYRSRWGSKFAPSAKARFWQQYYAETDPVKKRALLRAHPQFASRQPKTEAEIAEGKFWASYAAATKEERRKMLADNPQYNRRSEWTDEQWDEWKKEKKSKERKALLGWGDISTLVKQNQVSNEKGAAPVVTRRKWGRTPKKVVWRV